ncbi:MAG TPA: BamA/TamA family outer membrane protein [Longimicrobiaceae bacterium]|nr:BamA/TamA family outer membrane protein [Longimicrobiaceae bacterium]
MLIPLAVSLSIALAPAQDTTSREIMVSTVTDTAVELASAEDLRTAYVDPGARELVREARAHRDSAARAITSYETVVRRRISVGVEALGRDRLLYRNEEAARVHWSRDGVGRIEILGAREVVPMAIEGVSVPDDLVDDAPDFAFDPATDHLLDGFSDSEFIRHPLAAESEVNYRFRSGDTMRIRLPDGSVVRLRELEVVPRRSDPHLLRGSLWLDGETHGVVRATFQLARPLNMADDLEVNDDDVPGMFSRIEAELRYITIEYGLWEGRWWLPRMIALEVVANFGSLVAVPVQFEQTYSAFTVRSDSVMPVALDSLAAAVTCDEEEDEESEEIANEGGGITCECDGDACRRYVVELPADSATLLDSEYLPTSVYTPGVALISEGEMNALADRIAALSPLTSGWSTPDLQLHYLDPGLVRYNRVEGLSLGLMGEAQIGRLSADATVRYGFADRQVDVQGGVTRSGFRSQQRLAAYRRLNSVDSGARGLGLANSISSLLFGRDDGEYFRSLGVELVGQRELTPRVDATWRAFAERQSPAERHADWSFAQLLGSSDGLERPNIVAADADQVGTELTLGLNPGLNPNRPRIGMAASIVGSAGTFDFAKPSISIFGTTPLPGGVLGALEVRGGTSTGNVPVQSLWYVGGSSTVRGFGGATAISGETFWTARAELARGIPAARLILFSDAGWAGPRDAFTARPTLVSVGAGASLLDGTLRMDLARAVRGGDEWRLTFYLNGAL